MQVANALAKCPINCFAELHQKVCESFHDKKLPAFFTPSIYFFMPGCPDAKLITNY